MPTLETMTDHLNLILTLGTWLLGLAFAAGGAWFALREAQRHVNGVGAKLNHETKESQERYRKMGLALMSLASSEEKKKELLEWLK